MILEDHLKKCLSMTSGNKWKACDNKNLPRMNHSPFGDFPATYMESLNKAKNMASVPVPNQDQLEVSIAAKGTMVLKKGDGLGGKSVSLNKPKP